MFALKVEEFIDQAIIVAIADRRKGKNMIAVIVIADLVSEGLYPFFDLLLCCHRSGALVSLLIRSYQALAGQEDGQGPEISLAPAPSFLLAAVELPEPAE